MITVECNAYKIGNWARDRGIGIYDSFRKQARTDLIRENIIYNSMPWRRNPRRVRPTDYEIEKRADEISLAHAHKRSQKRITLLACLDIYSACKLANDIGEEIVHIDHELLKDARADI